VCALAVSDTWPLYPFEFYLAGTPISLQASAPSIDRWKAEVREAASERVRATVDLLYLEDRPLAITIYYFPSAAMQGDVDNIVKPIVDALEGLVYLNDRTIERVVVQKFEPAVDWQFVEPSEQLAKALDTASGRRPRTPGTVVQALAMLGYLDPEAERRMRTLIELRNRIVHGDLDAEPAIEEVELVLSAVSHTLNENAA
jgi:hypothetical protein